MVGLSSAVHELIDTIALALIAHITPFEVASISYP